MNPPHHRPSGRHFLQIPGPTNVPDRVLRAIDAPTIDHRGPEFAALGKSVIAGMKKVFKTDADAVIYPASGTGAWVQVRSGLWPSSVQGLPSSQEIWQADPSATCTGTARLVQPEASQAWTTTV